MNSKINLLIRIQTNVNINLIITLHCMRHANQETSMQLINSFPKDLMLMQLVMFYI